MTVKYDYTNNVLLTGYLGRGAWTVTNPFGTVSPTSVTPAPASADDPVPVFFPPAAPVLPPSEN
jgi:hypothetical protein